MNEVEIFNSTQLALISNGVYLLTFTGLIFITFRLIRYQRENNANMLGKIFVTIFGLCSVFYGYNVFSFLYSNQLAQSYRLSELQSNGMEISPLSENWIEFLGYTVSDGLPIPFSPEPAALLFLVTFGLMVVAGVWGNLQKN